MWKTAFKNLSRPYPRKIFKGCLPQNLLSPLLNTFSYILIFSVPYFPQFKINMEIYWMNLRIWSKLEKNVPEKLLIRIAFVTDIYRLDTETYSESCQATKMEHLVKKLTVFSHLLFSWNTQSLTGVWIHFWNKSRLIT